jgi:hypothetical protein
VPSARAIDARLAVRKRWDKTIDLGLFCTFDPDHLSPEMRQLIEAVKELANAEGLSASEWELNYYNRRV